MHRIQNIISVEPYKITCLWSNGEIRIIDFKEKISEWIKEKNVFAKLAEEKIFSSVQLDAIAKTLSWENMLILIDTEGNEIPSPLDFCPDELYAMSHPAEENFRKIA